jgi:hypothetical protein
MVKPHLVSIVLLLKKENAHSFWFVNFLRKDHTVLNVLADKCLQLGCIIILEWLKIRYISNSSYVSLSLYIYIYIYTLITNKIY